jgi:predicted peptidase
MRHVMTGIFAFVLFVHLSGCVMISENETTYSEHGEHSGEHQETGILSMMLSDGEQEQPAMVYVPRDYDPDEEWPLIVFLHGAGERGDDGVTQVSVGIATHILSNPERFPAIVYMPQCPKDWAWGTRANRDRPDASAFVTDGIEQILERYNIDEDRVSLTGLSMGGYGTFMYGAQNIERFSALMPICGGGNVADAAALAKRPMRVFHGGADDVVPPERSREMVEAIKEAGGDISYEEYPRVDHWSWDLAYGNADNIAWLLEQRR